MSQVLGHQEQGQSPESLAWKRFKKSSQTDTNHPDKLIPLQVSKLKDRCFCFTYTNTTEEVPWNITDLKCVSDINSLLSTFMCLCPFVFIHWLTPSKLSECLPWGWGEWGQLLGPPAVRPGKDTELAIKEGGRIWRGHLFFPCFWWALHPPLGKGGPSPQLVSGML